MQASFTWSNAHLRVKRSLHKHSSSITVFLHNQANQRSIFSPCQRAHDGGRTVNIAAEEEIVS